VALAALLCLIAGPVQEAAAETDDSRPGASFVNSGRGTAYENRGGINIWVELYPAPAEPVTLHYTVTGSATRGKLIMVNGVISVDGDYAFTWEKGVGEVEVPAGSSPHFVSRAPINLYIHDDTEVENDETVVLTLVDGTGYQVGHPDKYTLTIKDTPTPTVTLAITPNPVAEGEKVTVTAKLSEAWAAGGTIPLKLTAGTAEAGDYGALAGISIPAGHTSGTGTVTTTQDDDSDDETFTVAIHTAALPTAVVAGDPSSVEVTITDNDDPPSPPAPPTPVVSFAAASSTAEEDAGTQNVVVNLSPAPQSGITLNYSVGGTATPGADFTRLSGTVAVSSGTRSVNIPVTIIDDEIDDGGETVVLTLQGGTDYTLGKPSRHTFTIENDDPSPPPPPPPPTPVVSFAAAKSIAGEDSGTHNVAVSLAPAPQADITLRYSVGGTAVSGSDYAALSGTVAVPSGAGSVSIPVIIIDDSSHENSETIVLTLTTGSGYSLGSSRRHTLTITDNDAPPPPPTPVVSFTAASSTAGEDVGTRNVVVNLTPAPEAGITLNYSVGGTATPGTDFTKLSGSVAVSARARSVNIPVTITDDSSHENSETIVLTLTTGSGYSLGNSRKHKHTLTITDNDPPPTISIADASAEEGQAMSFTVRISPLTASVTLSWATANRTAVAGQDYAAVSDGTVTIPVDTGMATFKVDTSHDHIDEDDETFTVTLSGDLHSTTVNQTATGTIRDDDSAGIELSTPALRFTEPRRGARYTVSLLSQPLKRVALAVAADRAGIAAVSPAELIFTPSNWHTPQTVTVTAVAGGTTSIVHRTTSSDTRYANLRVSVRVQVDEDLTNVAVPWLARFARSTAGNLLEGIEGRLTASRTHGASAMIAGRIIEPSQAPGRALSAFAGTPHAPTLDAQPLSAGEVLPGTAFALRGEQDEGLGSLALWGHGAWSHFDGKEDSLSLDGEVATGMLGVDGAVGPWLLGLALSHNAGAGSYSHSPQDSGDLQASLTIATPYAAGQVTDRLTVYGALGYGVGELSLSPRDRDALATSTGFAMASAGARADIVSPPQAAGFGLAATTNALLLRASSQHAGSSLAAFDADISLLRVGLEGSWSQQLGVFGSVRPRLQIGARHDAGHAETGSGLEFGGGLEWSVSPIGLGVTAESRGLIAHVDDNLTDWGASASIFWDPTPATPEGPALSLRHHWGGASAGGLDALFAASSFDPAHGAGSKLLTAEATWGFALSRTGGIGTFFLGLGGTDSAHDYSLGWRLSAAGPNAAADDLSLDVSASLLDHLDDTAPDPRFGVQLISRW